MLSDLRYACRTLFRSPGFTVIAVVVLALGIGANTAVFSVINAVLLRPLPYPHPEQLCIVRENLPEFKDASVSYPDYLDWRAGQRSFTDLALFRRDIFNVSFSPGSGITPERVKGSAVSANYLAVLGMHPALGRDFTEAEDTPGGPAAALLSDSFWRQHFSADPAVIGQRIVLDGVSSEIIGVLPPQIDFPRKSAVVVPMRDARKTDSFNKRGNHPGLSVFGRLRPGVSEAQGNQDLGAIAAELTRRYPDSNTGVTVAMRSLMEFTVEDYRKSLFLLLGAVAGVLLIACANVANLQLARASTRTKELAVRVALGASRARLVRQLLTESALLGALGGGLGLLLALWLVDVIISLSTALPRFQEARLDPTVLAVAAVVSVGTGLLAGVWPAWRLSRIDAMAAALRESSARGASGGVGQGRARAALVVTQVALAVVLLTGAGLVLRGFYEVQDRPFGFRPSGLLVAGLSLPETNYTDEKTIQFDRTLLASVRALPDVESAAVVLNEPFGNSDWESDIHVTGTPPYPPGQEPSVQVSFASADYFKTMGMSILHGRDFGPQDVAGQPPVAVIDENLARQYFPGRDPIGQHFDNDMTTDDKNTPPFTIIGVVPHVRHEMPGENLVLEAMPQVYICNNQFGRQNSQLVVRAKSGDPLRLTDSLRQIVLGLDPELPMSDVATMDQHIATGLAPRRLTMLLLGAFAVVALGLATVGLYGVMALSVTQRTRELGIRMALGAQRSTVLALVLRQGAVLVAVGLGVGLAAALGLGRLLASVLDGAGASNDLPMLGAVCALLAAAALLACWIPARRATKLDPMVALRDE